MSPYRRNILVGVTVLGAMVVLGWMILKFGDRPARLFATPSIPVSFTTENADGLGEGSNITYRGVIVGHINTVNRTPDGKQVIIQAEVDKEPPLPVNVEGVIRPLGQLGPSANLNLVTKGDPAGQLASGASLPAHFEPLTLFPPEATVLSQELTLAVKQFRESNIIANLNDQVTRAGKVLESANQIVGDPKLRENIQATISNIRSASETINRVGGKFDKLADDASNTMGTVRTTIAKTGDNIDSISKQVGDRLTQISATLDHFQSITAKIDDGKGTAGMLLNDPKLYQSLVDSSRELNATITDLKRLVEQWEQEGVHLKLAK